MDVGSGAIIEGSHGALVTIEADLRKARDTKERQLERIPMRHIEAVRAMSVPERKAWANKRKAKRKAQRVARRRQRKG